MEETDKFKERAYEILYEKYKELFEHIKKDAMNKIEYGKDKDKIEFLSFIANPKKYSYNGIMSKEDIKIV